MRSERGWRPRGAGSQTKTSGAHDPVTRPAGSAPIDAQAQVPSPQDASPPFALGFPDLVFGLALVVVSAGFAAVAAGAVSVAVGDAADASAVVGGGVSVLAPPHEPSPLAPPHEPSAFHLLGHDHTGRRDGRAMHRRERRGLSAAHVADIPRPYGD
jgi:hypothetical protein